MRRLAPLLLLLSLSCGGDSTDDPTVTGPLSGCDPLDPSVCALPFPSSHFLVEDETTPTGFRVNFGPDSLPLNRDNVKMVPTYWNERDGYSINSAMLVYLPDVVLEGVVGHDDLDAYTAADVKTVVIDAETGERLPHWVELDTTAPSDEQRLLTIRPAVPMEWDTRYVVGIRGMNAKGGGLVPSSPAFAALRDGTQSDLKDVELRRDWFETSIFPVLEEEGFARADLQLAWDFRTASRENTIGKVEWLIDDALAWVEEQGGFDYTLTSVQPRDCTVEGEDIALDLEGTFVAPLYTVADGPEEPNDSELQAVLTRDDQGRPFRNGTTVVDFLARVPCSVARGADGNGAVAGSAAIVQYGHGLLGGKGEARGGYLARMANRYGFVLLAQDWTGFASEDQGAILLMLAAADQDRVNPSDFNIVSERAVQGMIEKVLGMRLLRTDLADDPALTFDDAKVIDPSRAYYYGNSQGAIMGSALLAMSPDIQRGVLGVGGGPYSLLLPRSRDFDAFFLLLKNKYLDHREIMLFVAGLTQQLWDPTEPGGWIWEYARAENPKEVLLQVGIYDNQVTTLGAQYQARAYGAFTPSPAVRPIWGVEEVDVGAGRKGNALVEWRYEDLPDEPFEVVPPGSPMAVEGTVYADGRQLDPHECVRREREAQDQLWHFLETGEVIQTCGEGGCVSPSATGCGD